MPPNEDAAAPLKASEGHGFHGLGRAQAFQLAASTDPVFAYRLLLDGPLPGWIVLTISGDPLAKPRRPLLRILRGAEAPEDVVLPGPALGRAHWIGLIPQDATGLLLALDESHRLERVGRRNVLGILAECLIRRPGNAFAALYEGARGRTKRCRDVLRGGVAVTRMPNYERWARARSVSFAGPVPKVRVACVILARGGEGAAAARTLASLAGQTTPAFSVTVTGDMAQVAAPPGLPMQDWDGAVHPRAWLGDGDALCCVRAGDLLYPDALRLLSAAMAGSDLSDAELVYADEVGPDGRPRLKPDWSPDLALATGYVGRPALIGRRLIEALPVTGLGLIGEAGAVLDAAIASACRHAVHIPRPLASTVGAWPCRSRNVMLNDRLAAAQSPARAIDRAGVTDIQWPLPDPAPLVSVVIPTRDRPDLIRTVCRGVLGETAYSPLELIVVDNGSTDPEVLAFYEDLRADPRVRILPFPHPFDFAAMVNAGVALAAGRVTVLLNNDIAVGDPAWLTEMVRQAIRPEVGAVGAKLLFGDGTLQHAGVVVGLAGRAGHILRRRPADTPGHLRRLTVAHEVSAVTAACIAVETTKYRAVDGFDSKNFPIDFNDVDFCLRLQARGWKTIWTPWATLSHLESISRGPSVGAKRTRFEEEARRFTDRWREVIRHDPSYHPALSLTTFGEDLE